MSVFNPFKTKSESVQRIFIEEDDISHPLPIPIDFLLDDGDSQKNATTHENTPPLGPIHFDFTSAMLETNIEEDANLSNPVEEISPSFPSLAASLQAQMDISQTASVQESHIDDENSDEEDHNGEGSDQEDLEQEDAEQEDPEEEDPEQEDALQEPSEENPEQALIPENANQSEIIVHANVNPLGIHLVIRKGFKVIDINFGEECFDVVEPLRFSGSIARVDITKHQSSLLRLSLLSQELKEQILYCQSFKSDIIEKIKNNEVEVVDLTAEAREKSVCIEAKYLMELAEVMSRNASVKSLNITNKGHNTCETLLDTMAEMLQRNKDLLSLSLDNLSGDNGNGQVINLEPLARALAMNTTLKNLSFYYSHEDASHIIHKALGYGLALNHSIENFVFGYHQDFAQDFEGDLKLGFFSVMEGLEKNESIKYLKMQFCNVPEAIKKRICSFLRVNKTLRYFEFKYILDEDEDESIYINLAKSLKSNTSITTLGLPNMYNSLIPIRILNIILDLAKHNKSLTHIFIKEGRYYDQPETQKIVDEINLHLNLNLKNHKKQKREVFLNGFANISRNHSSLKKFGRNITYDRNLIRLIFDFAGLTLGQKLKPYQEFSEPMPLEMVKPMPVIFSHTKSTASVSLGSGSVSQPSTQTILATGSQKRKTMDIESISAVNEMEKEKTKTEVSVEESNRRKEKKQKTN